MVKGTYRRTGLRRGRYMRKSYYPRNRTVPSGYSQAPLYRQVFPILPNQMDVNLSLVRETEFVQIAAAWAPYQSPNFRCDGYRCIDPIWVNAGGNNYPAHFGAFMRMYSQASIVSMSMDIAFHSDYPNQQWEIAVCTGNWSDFYNLSLDNPPQTGGPGFANPPGTWIGPANPLAGGVVAQTANYNAWKNMPNTKVLRLGTLAGGHDNVHATKSVSMYKSGLDPKDDQYLYRSTYDANGLVTLNNPPLRTGSYTPVSSVPAVWWGAVPFQHDNVASGFTVGIVQKFSIRFSQPHLGRPLL